MPSSHGPQPEKSRKTAGNGAGRGLAAQNGGRVFRNLPTGSAQDIHRPPPHSVEAEQGVLGSMLISPREAIAEFNVRAARGEFAGTISNPSRARARQSSEN